MQPHIILQARLGSRRLPGKALLPLAGWPSAILAAKRASRSGGNLTFATGETESDDLLAETARGFGLDVFRGSEADVLARFDAAIAGVPDSCVIVRLTGDNVFPDADFVAAMAEAFTHAQVDILGTRPPADGLPYGLSAEVLKASTLREAARLARSQHDREHVTPWIWEHRKGAVFNKFAHLNCSHLRCTLDTAQDYAVLCDVLDGLNNPIDISWRTLVDKLASLPERPGATGPIQQIQKKSPDAMRPTSPISLFSLTDRVAIVTGAAGHLGAAISLALGQAGAKVYLLGRRQDILEQHRLMMNSQGLLAEVAALDITRPVAVKEFIRKIQGNDERLDIIVNNAYGMPAQSADEQNSESFLDAYKVTVSAAHNLFEASLPLLRSTAKSWNAPSVINIASMYGLVSPDMRAYEDSPVNPPYYGAAKAGLIQLTRYLACQFAAENIRVNSISPGAFPSPTSRSHFPRLMRNLKEKIPMARFGEPGDIIGAVIFLASNASTYVTGTNLVVDGGWTAW